MMIFVLVANSRGGSSIRGVCEVYMQFTSNFVDVASESVWSGVANKRGAFIPRVCIYSTLLMFDANDHCWSSYPSPFS